MDTFFILAAKYLVALPVIVLAIYFLTRPFASQKRMFLFAIPAALVSWGLGILAGLLYYDPRPFVVGHFTPLVAHAADNGFPSDHTLLAAALAMIALYWNRTLGLALWIITIIIAIARVYVGVHHPADVIGSMVIALIGVLIVRGVFGFLQQAVS